jgi:ribosomal protein S18 acetylase RimI-like enzyme
MNRPGEVSIRRLRSEDCEPISGAFTAIGWNKPVEQYRRYLEEQAADIRPVLVAFSDGEFAGYVTVRWQPHYSSFPEIQDLNVLPQFRRRGIATGLVDQAEALVAARSEWVGIGVGMYPDYGPAQRMYVLRGYVPDGRGLTYRDRPVAPMERVIVDDDLVLFFRKRLR